MEKILEHNFSSNREILGGVNLKKKNKFLNFMVVVTMMFFVAGCGTVSKMRRSDGDKKPLDLSPYSKVVVLDFEDKTSSGGLKGMELESHKNYMKRVCKRFSDTIADNLKDTGVFTEVAREVTNEDVLLITGKIVQYSKGNLALKLFVGLGTGSTRFNGDVFVIDNVTKKELGCMKIDLASCCLAGVTALENLDDFIEYSAKKIAHDLAEAKNKKE